MMKHKYKPLLLAMGLTAGGLFTACEKQGNEPLKPQNETGQKRKLPAEEQAKANNYQQAALRWYC